MSRDPDALIKQKFAESGDVGLSGINLEEGWTITYSTPGGLYPERIQFNQLFRYIYALAVEINSKGPFLEYDGTAVVGIDYEVGAIVEDAGILYECLIANGPGSTIVNPVGNPLTWSLYIAAPHKATHQDGGADKISVNNLFGVLLEDQHVKDSEVLSAAGTNTGVSTMSALSLISNPISIGSPGGGTRSIIINTGTSADYLKLSADGTSSYIHSYGSQSMGIGTVAAVAITFITDNTVRMTVNNIGSVNVVGIFTAGTKTFVIDHPVDPTEKTLTHGVFEGPEHGLLYRGKTKLKDGWAVISFDKYFGMMPGTFAALTQDVVIQSLQNQDSFSRLRPGFITEDTFEIICEDESSQDEVSWVVMAARADKLVVFSGQNDDDGRLILETDKEEETEEDLNSLDDEIKDTDDKDKDGTEEAVPVSSIMGKKGRYMHFEAYGVEPPTKNVTYRYKEPNVKKSE